MMGFDFEKDMTEDALETMETLGWFAPTVAAGDRLVKGYLHDEEGVCKAYINSTELHNMARDLVEVADWLDARAEAAQGDES